MSRGGEEPAIRLQTSRARMRRQSSFPPLANGRIEASRSSDSALPQVDWLR